MNLESNYVSARVAVSLMPTLNIIDVRLHSILFKDEGKFGTENITLKLKLKII